MTKGFIAVLAALACALLLAGSASAVGAIGVAIQAKQGQEWNGVIARLQGDSNMPFSLTGATVDWGDGTTNVAEANINLYVFQCGCGYRVTGSAAHAHTWSSFGTYRVRVTFNSTIGTFTTENSADVTRDPSIPLPKLKLPADMRLEATSAQGAPASFDVGIDDTDPQTYACQPASGSILPVGATTVNCTATDQYNTTVTSGSFTVNVVDTTSPTLAPQPSRKAEANSRLGARVTYATPAGSDVVDGSVAAVCEPSSGSIFRIGSTLVDCTATDRAGNSATSSFRVVVRDTTPPVFSRLKTVNSKTRRVAYVGPTAVDAVDGRGSFDACRVRARSFAPARQSSHAARETGTAMPAQPTLP
jgi:HYR domain-containing protein